MSKPPNLENTKSRLCGGNVPNPGWGPAASVTSPEPLRPSPWQQESVVSVSEKQGLSRQV